MIGLYLALILVLFEGIRAAIYRLFGYRITIKILPIAYTEARVLDWNWVVGVSHQNDRDDPSDLRHRPRTLRDQGFSVEPLWIRIQAKRTMIIRDGSGRFYDSEEQRLRVHESQRKRSGKVLPDYTSDDYHALIGKES